MDMLTRLLKKFHFIEYTVVEPSAQRMSSFKARAKERKDVLNGVTFIWREETLQDFCTAIGNSQGKFHFVSAIHSLYYIPRQDFDKYLGAIIERTEGKVLIVNSAGNLFYVHIYVVVNLSDVQGKGRSGQSFPGTSLTGMPYHSKKI